MMNNSLLEMFKNIDLFLKFFNNISDLVYLLRVKEPGIYEYMFANEPARAFTNLAEEDFGKCLDDVLDERTAMYIREKYQEAISLKEPVTYEEELIGEELDLLYFETTITPVFNSQDECTHILAIARDITERRKRDKEIERVKKRLELIWNSTADAVYTIDKKANFTQVNEAFANLLGWTEEELLADRKITIIPNACNEDLNGILEKLHKGETISSLHAQRKHKDGSLVDVLASYSPFLDNKGRFDGAAVIYKDITEQLKFQKQLQESEEKYRLIAEHSSDLIKVLDLQGNVLYASPSHQHILNIDPEYYVNKSFKTFLHQEDMYKLDSFIGRIIQTKEADSVQIRAAKKNGEWVWIDSVGTPVMDEEDNIIKIITEGRDVSERKLYEEKLKKLALYDHLTELPNRRLFIKELKNAMETSSRTQTKLGVMFMDLDRFKWVNDTMGHDVGDQLLVEFSKRVRSCLREEDLLARFAGDEFLVMVPDLKEESQIYPIAERILNSLQEDWEIEGQRFSTTSSMGIAFYQPYDQNYKDLLRYADEALYKAKERGKNRYQVYVGSVDKEEVCDF
ncbi:diguanylate cyclase [Rossellomorea vietnamensis]|uniref:Diguanylate cyclase n=1 Tax=Rossellomorea vietnamensis TaxID=218284 RepID=A0A5D4MCW0_9BACI|nr:diguanylate cyclase [Rossellomorea vietnamensis]TYR98855.1 diguanylate cyclase [Rossellomorea vietnamensis]